MLCFVRVHLQNTACECTSIQLTVTCRQRPSLPPRVMLLLLSDCHSFTSFCFAATFCISSDACTHTALGLNTACLHLPHQSSSHPHTQFCKQLQVCVTQGNTARALQRCRHLAGQHSLCQKSIKPQCALSSACSSLAQPQQGSGWNNSPIAGCITEHERNCIGEAGCLSIRTQLALCWR